MPSPSLLDHPFIIDEIELCSGRSSLTPSNAATPPDADPIDEAFQECLVTAEASAAWGELRPPLQPTKEALPASAPCATLSTPVWSSTPISADCNIFCATFPWSVNGLITPTTGQIPTMAYPSLDSSDNIMSVPMPHSTWPTGLGGNDQQFQSYAGIGFQGTYNTSTHPSSSPEQDQIPRPAYTAPTSPPTFGVIAPDRHSTYSHSRRRSATMNTTSTFESSSPSTPPHPNYPYPSHRPELARQPSASSIMSSVAMPLLPEAQSKKVFHPAPSLQSCCSSVDVPRMTHPDGVNLGGGGGGMLFHPQQYGFGDGLGYGGGEAKPARFKPTKEQLDILIRSYNENKNPDAATREALARQLGPDVKPKTLQIWFQNRRSKSRAKEREANLPKRLDMKGRTTSPSQSGSMNIKRTVDIDALKQLVHDEDPSLLLIPITVLSIAAWTRFLTPGIGYTLPDLGCSVSLSPTPILNLYIVHKSETFKIVIPINTQTMSNIQGASNPVLNTDAVAMKFDLSPGCAQFMGWRKGMAGRGDWQAVGDFTTGNAGNGGKVEITGEKNALLNAFTRIHGLVESLPTPLASARSGDSGQGHFSNLSQTWNSPKTASTFGESFFPPLSAAGSQPPLSGCGMDFLTLNPPAPQTITGSHMRRQSLSVNGGEFKHPGMAQRHHSSQSVNLPAQPGTFSAQDEKKLDRMLGLPWTSHEFTVPPPQAQSPEQQWSVAAEAPPLAEPQPIGGQFGTDQGSHARNLSVPIGASGASLGSLGFSNMISDKMYEYDAADGLGGIEPMHETSMDDAIGEFEDGVEAEKDT